MTERIGYFVLGVAGGNAWQVEFPLDAGVLDVVGEALNDESQNMLGELLRPMVEAWIAERARQRGREAVPDHFEDSPSAGEGEGGQGAEGDSSPRLAPPRLFVVGSKTKAADRS